MMKGIMFFVTNVSFGFILSAKIFLRKIGRKEQEKIYQYRKLVKGKIDIY